jgi:predicted metal-dependent enzyme (double-stranded beta helix superfamily)
MYTLDRLLNNLRDAVGNEDPTAVADAVLFAIREKPLVSQARSSQLLHSEPGLTIVHIAVNPGFVSPLHDHRTWAVIGIYEGQEDNTLYRRTDDSRGVEPSGSRSLRQGEVLPLRVDAIHQITNPLGKKLIALHVYGKNIFNIERSAWDPVTGQERPFQLALDGHGRIRPS